MTHLLPRIVFLTSAAFVLSFTLIGCSVTTNYKAGEVTDAMIAEVCQRWTPITDTSSPQTRRLNRGRYALCEPTN